MKESSQLLTQALELGGSLSETWQTRPENHTLYTRLAERRISTETISAAQIRIAITPNYAGKGWEYPTPSGGTRFKSARDQGAKYYWIPSKPSGEVFYYLPELPDAILSARLACWYTSESDLWALHSAGIRHVLGHYGESSVPDELPTKLQKLNVTVLYIAPDRDETGKRWAQKVAQALDGSGIELSCRELPDTLGEKADLGRAWETYTKTLDFERWLVNLPSYEPTITEPLTEPSLASYSHTPEYTAYTRHYTDEIPAAYKQAIAEALGAERGKNCACPFTEHHENRDGDGDASLLDHGLFCHVSGELYLWNDLGVKLEIGSIGEWRRVHEHQVAPSVQLSTETREALIKASYTALARFIDALYSLGWQAGEIFSRSDAEKALEGILTSWTIRKAIKQGEGENIDKRESKYKGKYKQAEITELTENIIKCGNLSLFFLHPSKAPISHNKYKGRPKTYYKLPSKKEISQAFGIISKVEHHDTIKLEHIKSAPQYRAEIYAALIRRRPSHYSRRTHSKRIGVSPTTTRKYDELAQVEVIPREPEKVELSIGKISQLPENWDNSKAGFIWLETRDGRKFRANKRGGEKALAHAQELGGQVYKLKRRSSFYKDGRKE
jgi:hypothetical protein